MSKAKKSKSAKIDARPTLLKLSQTPSLSPEQRAAYERWEAFQEMSLDEKLTQYQAALAEKSSDAEEAFEMLEEIRTDLDVQRDPAHRARYAELVERLRTTRPDIYKHDAAYLLSNLIDDALEGDPPGRLAELLMRFAKEAPDELDIFYHFMNAVAYYGRLQPLLAAMQNVDAEQLEHNQSDVILAFMAAQCANGMPLARGWLARELWMTALNQQNSAGRRSSASSRAARPSVVMNALVPRRQSLDLACAEQMHFLSPQPHQVAAALELLPDYLHFVAIHGLIGRADLKRVLDDLRPLAQQAEQLLINYRGDPRLPEYFAAAWSNERLTQITQDPAVPEDVAPPPPAPKVIAPRPGATTTYQFKVTYRFKEDCWRVVELTAEQTLRHLHAIIQDAFDFDDDHLYSFFMSGKAWTSKPSMPRDPNAASAVWTFG